jgi:hypothetical protein
MSKVVVLAQKTSFCQLAARKLMERFKDKIQCETIGSFSEGRSFMEGREPEDRVMLIWGNGMMHHFSNILNIPS